MKKTITMAAVAAIMFSAGVALAGQAAPVCGDVNDSSSINTTDALLVLKKSVDQPITLKCSAYDLQLASYAAALTATNANLSTCNASLNDCNSDLSATDAQLITCKNALAGVCIPNASADPRFVDNADGTVTDKTTCLMWEKKNGVGGGQDFDNPHDVDNGYQWSSTGTAADGSAFTDFLVKLNAPAGAGSSSATGPTVTGCFAQHCDWRLPTIEELHGIPWPALPAFLPDYAGLYWSASTHAGDPANAWYRDTAGASVDFDGKLGTIAARAVRRAF
jgi:hypothetical protein